MAAPTRPSHSPSGLPSPQVLAALAANSSTGLAWLQGGRVSWCNDAFAQLLGHAASDCVGRTLPQLWHDLDAAEHGSLATRLQAGEVIDTIDLPFTRADGSIAWRRLNAGVVQAPPEEPGQVLTLLDISDWVHERSERQRVVELLDMAQEFGRIGVWERDVRTEQGSWDRHVWRFWGVAPGEGALPMEEAARYIHPDDHGAEVLRASMQRAGTYSQRYRVLRPDGSVRMLHSQWEVKNGADGRPARAIGIMMDDTEVYELAQAAMLANEQLDLAVDLARIAIWRHDLKTQRLHYNARAWEVLGMPPQPDGLSLHEVRALIHPDDVPHVRASAERALRSDEPTDMQARYRRSDGSWRHVLTRRVVQRDGDGQPVAFLGVALDITEQAEQARRSSELAARLEAAARAARLGLWSTDVRTGELHWNEQMHELFGTSPTSQPATFRDWLERCVHPEDASRVLAAAKAWVRAGDQLLDLQYRTVLPDGRVRWLVNRSDVQRGRNGELVFGITLDITEQRAAMDALRSANERSALAARGVGMGTWELDLRDGSAFWDEQMFALRGLPPRPMPLSTSERLALVHPDDRQAITQAFEGGLSEGRPTSYEFRVRLPDGSWRWLASRSATLFDEQGQPVRRIGVNWDITDTKNAEAVRNEKAVAQRESEAKSQFMARMSHELRTPLNAVLGFTQLLIAESDHLDAAALRLRLGHIRSAGQHLLSLINDVLDLSSLDTGELRMQLQPVPIAELVRGTLPLVERMAHEYQVRLRAGTLHGTVQADPTRLRQVLLNLLSNAIKYNRAGGHVIVNTVCEDGIGGAELCLQVSDSGRGLTPQQLRHAFEPFNRLGAEREAIEGTGIGLAIVKALAERMGGRVHVRSEAGAGSTFEVWLPRLDDAPVPAPPPPTHIPEPAPAPVRPERRGRLLYIEDNPVNVLIVSELVAMRPGLKLDVAADGLTGITMAAQLQPDLVLVDMQLPDIDGHEVLRRLRTTPATAQVPCIALSANAMPEDIQRALQAGFADYWTKPLDLKAFMASIDALFA